MESCKREYGLSSLCSYIPPSIVITLALIGSSFVVDVTSKTNAIKEFRNFEIIVPVIRCHGKQQICAELDSDVGNISIEYTAFGKQTILELQLNRYLFSGNYSDKHVHQGSTNDGRSGPLLYQESEHCYYIGFVAGEETSSTAAISTCSGLRGYITTDIEGYHIQSIDHSLTGRHYVFRDSDYIGTNFTCGHKDVIDMRRKRSTSFKLKRSLRRSYDSAFKSTIRWPYDANDKTMLVELYIANDFEQYKSLQRDVSEVVRRTKDIVNIVSSLYRPLNIYVALVGVEVWVDGDKIEIVDNADKTMNNFLDYRRNYICPKHRNDNAQLITGRTLGDGVVGKAPIMTICTWQYSGGVNLDHSPLVGPVATTVAHEMGHNFGLTHDTDECGCPDDRCIMASSSGGVKNPTKWSECSKQQFADSFYQGMDYCLHDLPQQLYGGPVCGNGFTEAGEQCDCGLPQDCTTSCCNATTCKLQPNASCAMGECCDQATCQLKPAATLCRADRGDCDLGEYCNGINEYCPSDAYRPDGTECHAGSVLSYCYRGQCNSHSQQCKLLWGPSGVESHRRCYENFNVLGTVNGHCGFSWIENKSFKKCEQSDVMCGMLHCNHHNEKLMFWKEALAYTLPEAWVQVNTTRFDCKGVILDVGLDMPDPGMVPDGAKCGDGKMCIGQRCVSIVSLGIKTCPDCHSHGVCNNLQQCHCDPGYAPPYCDKPGDGGSEHSGPMSVQQYNVGLAVAMCLLGLVLLVALGVVVVCAYQHNEQLKQFWQEREKYRFRSVNMHRTDSERPPIPPPPVGRSPSKVGNGVRGQEYSMIYRPNNGGSGSRPIVQHQDRPRSVATAASSAGSNGALLPPAVAGGGNEVKRAASVRGAPISSPRLQSSTNRAILPSRPAPHRPYSMATTAASDEIQLMPTRAAPVPSPLPSSDSKRSHQNIDTAVNHFHHHQQQQQQQQQQPHRKAPSRPPLPAPTSALKNSDDGVPMNGPSGPPPAPPDSRHRFYTPNVSVPSSAMRNGGVVHANGQANPCSNNKSQSPRRNGVAGGGGGGSGKLVTGNGRIQNAEVTAMMRPSLPGGADVKDIRPHLPPKPVPTTDNHVSASPPPGGRLRLFRPGVNESQC